MPDIRMEIEQLADFLASHLEAVTAIKPTFDFKRDAFEFDFVDGDGIHRMVRLFEIERCLFTSNRGNVETSFEFFIDGIHTSFGEDKQLKLHFELVGAELEIDCRAGWYV